MKIQKNIAAAIKSAMEERNLSVVEFSKELGIGKTSLQDYLDEDCNMRADTIELVSEKLGITPAQLVSGPVLPEGLSEDMVHPLLYPIADDFGKLRETILNVSDALYKLERKVNSEKEESDNNA